MTITLIDSANRAEIAKKNNALELKSDGEAKSDSFEFGQLMADIQEARKSLEKKALEHIASTEGAQQMKNGQEFAAQTEALNMVFSNTLAENLSGQDFLKTVILGPNLNAITPEASLPDEQSLEAFARSQGLDETAVQWLLGTPDSLSAGTQPLTLEGQKLTTSPTLMDESDSAAAQQMHATDQLMAQIAITSGRSSLTNGAADVVMGDDSAHAANPSSLPSGQSQVLGVHSAANHLINKTEANTSGGLLTSAALWAMAQNTEKAHTQALKTDAATEANDIQIHFMRTPPPAALWMLGNAQVNGPVKETPSLKNSVATSELDLSDLASDELLTKLAMLASSGDLFEMDASEAMTSEGGTQAAPGAPPTPLSGHTGQRMELATAARLEAQNTPSSAPDANTAQRSETVQNLSEKMGQAVGQRILSAIEKGQWHLKLMLRPATLGHIEVEIRMRSGELDAVFTAPQALTRDLLQDGLSKLKDTLSQMGMDVASMLVGDGQTQQRGGDSTPSQTSKVTNSDSKESKSTETQQIDIPRTKMGKDGWDVLV
jgi:flagellar hook-length control protein FliK